MRIFLASLALVLVAGLAIASPIFKPRGEAPPPLRDEGGYLSITQTAIFNGPRSDVIDWLNSPEGSILAFTPATDRIPAVIGVEPISGDFSQAGDVRRVLLDGDESAVERVLVRNQETFSYQVWGFTASNARPVDHIRGTFIYTDLGDSRTEVKWTYSIAPRVFWVRPFIRTYLSNDFTPFMKGGLDGSAAAYSAQG